ncbi:hypothetical protein H0H92_005300 [Tricholoma furcatifolium]|nr:hypothetical protein H0H92_005300 [Tricholoma furcatifolium]
MALWLQRQEAMWMCDVFCKWVANGRVKALPVIVDQEDDENNEVVFTHVNASALPSPASNVTSRTSYMIAKCTPFTNVTVHHLASEFGAVDFVPTLTNFIRRSFPRSTIFPNQFDTFNLFKQIVITHPQNMYLGSHLVTSRIRTTPRIEAHGRKPETLAHFDTAFVIQDREAYKTNGGFMGEF